MNWIKVSENLPKFGIEYRYLFLNGKKEVTFGYAYNPKEGWDTGCQDIIWINDHDRCTNEVASYWMELPEPPIPTPCESKESLNHEDLETL